MKTSLPDSIREELYRLSFASTGYSSPNPPVACILQNANTGEILSAASTRRTGENHAEREAYFLLRKKIPRGPLPPHHVYVTLEPCSHFGKTPPCVDILLQEKPLKLAYGWNDPNPLVREHSGLDRLIEAGIQVSRNKDLERIAGTFLFGFRNRIEKNRPAFLLKSSVSKEGFFSSGEEKREKISSFDSDFYLSFLRAKVDAILVGPKTVETDSPSLDFRIPENLPKRIFKLPNQPLSSRFGFSGLIEEALKWGSESEMIRLHRENLADYQPLRVFFLPPEERIPKDFLEKQVRLNEKYGKSSVAFFLPSETYSREISDRLSEISDSKLAFYTSSDVFSFVSERLADWGVNLALVEGGNFLYKNFSKNLGPEDSILQVRSKGVSFSKGILPVWDGNFSMEWKAELESDEWEVGKNVHGTD